MATVMRSIALLDGSFGKVRLNTALRRDTHSCVVQSKLKNKVVKMALGPEMLPGIKRRVGYGLTEAEADREVEKRARMDVAVDE